MLLKIDSDFFYVNYIRLISFCMIVILVKLIFKKKSESILSIIRNSNFYGTLLRLDDMRTNSLLTAIKNGDTLSCIELALYPLE